MAASRSVLILAFDDMEVLDYAGPYEVFNVAGELGGADGELAFTVRSVALVQRPVVGRGGFTVTPDLTLSDASETIPTPDVLVVPGGAGCRRLQEESMVLEAVRRAAQGTGLLVSVCSGSLVLAAAGLLADRPATTHHKAYQELADVSPSTDIRRGHRFVAASERIWTSGGISAGIDLSLHLVGRLCGPDVLAAVVEEMEWGWGGNCGNDRPTGLTY